MIRSAIVERIPPPLRVAKRAIVSRLSGEPELGLLPALCDRRRLALDIGANLGVYTWHLSRLAAGVVAFEPQPDLAEFLRRAFGGRVRVEQAALSDARGETALRVPRERAATGRATIEPANRLADFEVDEIRVPVRRLDDYELAPVGLIKLDVEGHELAVLRGALALLARDRPTLVVEAEDRHRPNALETVRDLLAPLGYTRIERRGGGWVPARDVAAAGNAIFAAGRAFL